MTATFLALTAAVLIGGCTRSDKESRVPTTISQVLQRHTDSLMNIPGVVGTAEGSCAGRPCILVLVERATPEVRKGVPSQIDGFAVEIRESGPIEAR